MGRSALLLVATAVGACSAFSGVEPSQSPGDAGNAAETGGDAPTGSDGGVAFVPCSQRPANAANFCDDFDAPGDITALWKTPAKSDGGVLGDTDAALSSPRALVARVPAGNEKGAVTLKRDRLPNVDLTTKTRLVLRFALRVDAAPFGPNAADGYAQIAALWFDEPTCVTSGANRQRSLSATFNESGKFYLEIKGFGGLCADGGGPDYVTAPARYTLADFAGKPFRRVAIEVIKRGCADEADHASVRMHVDDTTSECRNLVEDPFAKTGAFHLQLGPLTGGPIADTVLVYDDVSIEFE